MDISDLANEVKDASREIGKSIPHLTTCIDGLSLFYADAPTRFEAMIYDPVICLILQGRKETRIGDRVVRFGAGESLIVSHTLPVTAAITEASDVVPYMAMILSINLGIARGLYDQVGDLNTGRKQCESLTASKSAPELIDAFGRLFRASQNPVEAEALAPLIIREVHFRLLQAEHGAMLRQLLWRDSAASKVGRVMTKLRDDLAAPLSVPEMAGIAGMSVSAFHEHFKEITGTSPLQYRKDLRLTEARRRLRETAGSVSSVAFKVGYESPTQFSREYTRKFGVSPRTDLARMRAA